jgi:hypothetical protein
LTCSPTCHSLVLRCWIFLRHLLVLASQSVGPLSSKLVLSK